MQAKQKHLFLNFYCMEFFQLCFQRPAGKYFARCICSLQLMRNNFKCKKNMNQKLMITSGVSIKFPGLFSVGSISFSPDFAGVSLIRTEVGSIRHYPWEVCSNTGMKRFFTKCWHLHVSFWKVLRRNSLLVRREGLWFVSFGMQLLDTRGQISFSVKSAFPSFRDIRQF